MAVGQVMSNCFRKFLVMTLNLEVATTVTQEKIVNESQFLIELTSVEVDTVDWTLHFEELQIYTIDSINYFIPIMNSFSYYLFTDDNKLSSIHGANPPYIFICKREVPSQLKLYTIDELRKSEYKVKKMIVSKESKVLKIQTKEEPIEVLDNQHYYNKLNWCSFRLMQAESH